MYGIDEVSNIIPHITKDDYLKYMTNEVGNGYSVKNISEYKGAYIIEVF